jgi:hypothetical protein
VALGRTLTETVSGSTRKGSTPGWVAGRVGVIQPHRLTRQLTRLVASRSLARLRANRPLLGTAGDLDGEAPVAECGDDEPTARVGASVWAWHGGQSATRRSRSKSEPPWARLTAVRLLRVSPVNPPT